MRMFRSVRNPVTKSGRTTNTTGSRIRSSARTLRENTASLVEAAKARVRQTSPGAGYSAATANRKNTASADYAGENARKRAYNAGAGKIGQRQAKYQGMKSASAPQGASTGYRAGYSVGKRVAAGRYKAGLQAYSPSGRTGLENRTIRNAGLVARREASDAYRAGASTVKATAQTAAIGAKQVARGAVRGGKIAAKAAARTYSVGQKVVFGTQSALGGIGRGFRYAAHGNYQTARYATMNAANAVKHGRSMADRIAAPINNAVEKGIDSAIVRPGRAAILGAGRAASAVAGVASNAIKNRQYAKARQNWNAANPPKMKRAGVFFNTGMQQTPMGRNSVAAGVRYQAAMAKKQAKQTAAAAPAPAAPTRQLSKAAQVRLANVRQMKQKGYTKSQIIQASGAAKRGQPFAQKPAGPARWGNKAAPNWAAFQPNAGGQNQPPATPKATPLSQAATAVVSGIRSKKKAVPSGNVAKYAGLVSGIRSRTTAARSSSAFQSMRSDPSYNSPIIPRGSAMTAPVTQAPASKPQALIPDAVEPPKRGKGRPKLTPEQQAASKARRAELQRQRRQNKGK